MTMPVVAVENLFCSFPRSGGRVLFASTVPTASTGSSSSRRHLLGASCRALLETSPPRMIGAGSPRPAAKRRPPRYRRSRDRQYRGWWAGGDAGRNLRPSHHTAAIPNLQVAGGILTHHDRAARRWTMALPFQLEETIVVAHDPIIRDRAVVLEPEHVIQPDTPRHGDVEVVGRGRSLRKAPIVVGPILRLEKRIGRFDVREAFPPEFLHQPILLRAVIALDPALGLRRTRRNDADAQRRTHAPELRQWLRARDPLLLIRRPHIDILPVGIECLRNPVALDPSAQDAYRGPDRFLRPEPPLRLPGRIVDEREQTALRPATFEPPMKATVQLDQLPKVRLALAAPSMRAALSRATPQARHQHPPAQRFVIDGHPIFSRQMFGRQRRPKALVDPAAVFLPDEREHPLPNRYLDRLIRRAPSAPMFQARGPFPPVPPIQPLRLAIAHVHQRRRRTQAQRPCGHTCQHAPALQLPRAHRCPSQSTTSLEVVSL